MKHEKLYLVITKGVEKALQQLDFSDEQEERRGHEMLRLLNALGALLTSMEVCNERLA